MKVEPQTPRLLLGLGCMVFVCLPGLNSYCWSTYSAVLCFISARKLCQLESCAENCGVRTLLHGSVKIASVEQGLFHKWTRTPLYGSCTPLLRPLGP